MGTMRKLVGLDFRHSRLISISAAIILSLFSLSFKPAPRNYVESLIMLKGTDYWTLNCSQYICAAERHRECLARNFWDQGCDGGAFVVQDVPSFEAINTSKLLPGDIAVFHGVHVAAFVGNGIWMDSDYRHGGVGIMRRNQRPGGWFYGEIKILRWKNQ